MSRICMKHCIIMLVYIVAIGAQSTFAASAHWQSDYEKAKKQALAESKPIVAMFTASWCGPCKRMKSTTLVDGNVKRLLRAHFVTVMIDTDRNPSLTRQFNITGMPTVVIIDPVTGKSERVIGFQRRGQFLSFLNMNKKEMQLASAVTHTEKPIVKTQPEQKGLLTSFCLVNIVNNGKLLKGNSNYSVEKEGYTVQFASAEDKQTFLKNPEKYWPQYNGNCPVMLTTSRRSVLGEARWSVEYDDKLFFCHSKEHAMKFIEAPAKFASQNVAAKEVGILKR